MSVPRQIGLFSTFFCLYLLLGSREMPWNDARVIVEVAESLVADGTLDVASGTSLGKPGKLYSPHALLPSLIHVPGALLAAWFSPHWPQAAPQLRVLFAHLGPAAMAALACLLLFHLARSFGASTRGATLGAITLGAGTLLAIYARSPGTEAVEAACFTGFFWWLARTVESPTRRNAIGLGVWAGLLLNNKIVFALSLPGAALIAAIWIARRHGRRAALVSALWAAAGALPLAVIFLAYNHIRTGSVFALGVPPGAVAAATFGQSAFVGLWGFLLSPGKSVLLFSPPLLLSLFALPGFLRNGRGSLWLWAFLATAGPVVVLTAKFIFWHGDWTWGPRFLVFLVPVALLPAVIFADGCLRHRRTLALAGTGTVLAAGIATQVLGGILHWDNAFRIEREARPQWLGQPNRAGALAPDRGGYCDPCLEDLYALHWLPPFQPLAMNAWILLAKASGKNAIEAAADAPWTRYTRVPIGVAGSYPRARLDWWLLEWKGDLRPRAFGLLALLAVALAASALLWTGRLRLPTVGRSRAAPAPEPAVES